MSVAAEFFISTKKYIYYKESKRKKAFSNKYMRDKMNGKRFISKTLIKNNLSSAILYDYSEGK